MGHDDYDDLDVYEELDRICEENGLVAIRGHEQVAIRHPVGDHDSPWVEVRMTDDCVKVGTVEVQIRDEADCLEAARRIYREVASQLGPAMPERAIIRHALTAENKALVLKFAAAVEKLWHTPMYGPVGEQGVSLKVDFHYDESPLKQGKAPVRTGFTLATPADDELAAMAIRLRLFILNNEPTNFGRVTNAIGRAFHDARVSDSGVIDGAKNAWLRLPHLVSMGCPLPGQELLELWYYANWFHGDDEAKAAQYANLQAERGEGLVRLWTRAAFTFAYSTITEFHCYLRDRTDVYEEAPFPITSAVPQP